MHMLKPAISLRYSLAAAAAAIVAASASAQAQTALTPQQCEKAISVSTGILTKYRGRISVDLAQSFGRFRDSKCDLKTEFTRVKGTSDDEAFGEFRVLLIALKTADIGLGRPRHG
jgi:hypothetical protein